MERQDLEDQLPKFQELWSRFDPSGSGHMPPKHLFVVSPMRLWVLQKRLTVTGPLVEHALNPLVRGLECCLHYPLPIPCLGGTIPRSTGSPAETV